MLASKPFICSWCQISLLCSIDQSVVWMVSWVKWLMGGRVTSLLPANGFNVFLLQDYLWWDNHSPSQY
jgi:hypothetical protein